MVEREKKNVFILILCYYFSYMTFNMQTINNKYTNIKSLIYMISHIVVNYKTLIVT